MPKNTINLTIKANANTATKLSSATIYGDGSNSTNIKAGTINMLIDADGATVGNVYASNRSIISSSGLARNVTTKIGEGTTIAGNIYNSASSDNLTSVYANTGSNVSMIQFGDGSGGLLNGTNATATNHAATYCKHGTIEMDEDSILAVSSSTSVISGSKLIAYPNATLSTPYVQTSGLINLSDLDLSTNKGNLFWKPIGNPPASISNTYNGAYWGRNRLSQF